MDDLVQFLRDRLVEDVVEAGKLDDADDWEMESWQVRRDETGAWDSYAYLRVAKARVLAEVDAKRRILDEIVPMMDGVQEGLAFEYGQKVRQPVSRDLLRLLALPYASHPDYRPEWAPDPVQAV